MLVCNVLMNQTLGVLYFKVYIFQWIPCKPVNLGNSQGGSPRGREEAHFRGWICTIKLVYISGGRLYRIIHLDAHSGFHLIKGLRTLPLSLRNLAYIVNWG